MEVLTLTLITSSLMLVATLITYLLYVSVRKGSTANQSSEPYLCGEGVDDFRSSISVGSTNLFWGSTSANLKKFYTVLRDNVHTGVLNDWLFFMGIWLTWGFIISFIVVALGG
ncbi:MAG: hypothetical protein QW267_04760 [Sulfolobales archaeon]